MRRLTILLCCLTALVACGGNDNTAATGPTTTRAGGGPVTTAAGTTTTVPAAPAPGQAPDGATTTTGAAGAAPTETTAAPTLGQPTPEPAATTGTGGNEAPAPSGGEAPAPAPEPDPASAKGPPSGTYVYDTTGFAEQGSGPTAQRRDLGPTSTTQVTTTQVSPTEVESVLRSEDDEGNSGELTLRSQPAETRLTRIVIESRQNNFPVRIVIVPDPPALVAKFPYTAGDQWDINWKDDAAGITASGTGKTLRQEDVETGMGTVSAWVIEIHQKIVSRQFGTIETTSTQWVNPETAVIVKRMDVSDSQSNFGNNHSESTSILQTGPSN